MTQAELWDGMPRTLTNRQRFEKFHREHPDVFLRLASVVRSLDAVGRKASIRDVFGYLRISGFLKGKAPDDQGYVLNNTHASHYARLLIEKHPELEGAVHTRELRSE